jgi:hypothetical protein
VTQFLAVCAETWGHGLGEGIGIAGISIGMGMTGWAFFRYWGPRR